MRGAHAPMVPGDVNASEILKRVAPGIPAKRMPPPYSDRKPLTEKEVASPCMDRTGRNMAGTLELHRPGQTRRFPTCAAYRILKTGWIRNPIDNFLGRLEREGLRPSPEADRARLLRRVTFDLTGLPPFEMLDDKIQLGYELRSSEATVASRIWLEAWDDVLGIFAKSGIQSIREFDRPFVGTQSLFNWIQDLEDELWRAGRWDREFLNARIAVCKEALRRFSDDDRLSIQNRCVHGRSLFSNWA